MTFLKYAYIDFPQNVNLKINNQQIKISNPFGSVIKHVVQDENLAIKGQSEHYRFWIIQESKLKEMGESIDNSKANFEGLLIYRGNEFVRKDEMAQPYIRGIQVQLGKRNHSTMNLDAQQSNLDDTLHGIIMIYPPSRSPVDGLHPASHNAELLSYDKQDLADHQFLQMIRDHIFKSYLESTS